MFLRNTSSYPDDEVKRLVEFATKGVNMKKVCVNVKGSRQHRWAGRAYGYVPNISNAPPSADYLIVLRLGEWGGPIPEKNYHGDSPDQAYGALPGTKPSSRFPFYRLDTWQELLVSLAAHEARHIHQFRHGKRRSEVDCERFAVKALERYRNPFPKGSHLWEQVERRKKAAR